MSQKCILLLLLLSLYCHAHPNHFLTKITIGFILAILTYEKETMLIVLINVHRFLSPKIALLSYHK